jgi:MoxR-like ATPase
MAYHSGDRPPSATGEDGAAPPNGHPWGLPLITVACHEDLTASDLVGRYLLQAEETVWIDGPLTRAVRSGSCPSRNGVRSSRRTKISCW